VSQRVKVRQNVTAVQIQREWHQLADLVRLAEYALRPRRGPGQLIRGKPESRPPINMAASKLLAQVDSEVGFYVHVLVDETKFTPPPGRERKIRAVADRVGHFMGDEDRAGQDMLDTAQTLISHILGVTMPTPPPMWAGPCESPGCMGDTWRKERGAITCDECDTRLDIDTWRERMKRRLESRLVYRDEIRPALAMMGVKVKPETLRSWIHRRRLTPVIVSPEMFRLTDVIDLTEASNTHMRISA
jgi:hypothetical protein